MMRFSLSLINILERIVDAVTFIIFLFLFSLGVYAIFDVRVVEKSADNDAEIAALSPSEAASDTEIRAKLGELKQINGEAVAWLRLNNTNINYPVVQGKDNTKYLTHGVRGDYATAGAAFIDYRNDKLNDNFTIIYGHRMSAGKMFSDVGLYADFNYFSSHQKGILWLEDRIYDLEVLNYAVLGVNSTSIYALNSNKNHANQSVLAEISANSKQSSNKARPEDKLLLLSTCDKDSRHFRDVLLTRLIERR